MPKSLPVVDISAPICCAPLADGPVGEAEAVELALRLKVLADPARLRLLSMVMAARPGEVCSCELPDAVGLSAGTVSHHMAQLRKAGMVDAERRGVNVFYRARPDSLEALRAVFACC